MLAVQVAEANALAAQRGQGGATRQQADRLAAPGEARGKRAADGASADDAYAQG